MRRLVRVARRADHRDGLCFRQDLAQALVTRLLVLVDEVRLLVGRRDEFDLVTWDLRKLAGAPRMMRLDDPVGIARNEVPPDEARTIERLATEQDQARRDIRLEDRAVALREDRQLTRED